MQTNSPRGIVYSDFNTSDLLFLVQFESVKYDPNYTHDNDVKNI